MKLPRTILTFAIVFAAASCVYAGTFPVVLPTIGNADFETGAAGFVQFPGYTSPTSPLNPPEITSWPGSGSRGINPGSGAGTAFRNNGGNSTNVAFLQGPASISQSIPNWEVGKEFRVTFDYNSRSGFAQPGLSATIGSGSETDTSVPAVGGSNRYYAGNIVFTPNNSTETLTFTNLNNPGDDTLLIDNVRVFRNGPSIAENGFETPNQGPNTFEQANGTGGGSLAGALWTISGTAGITQNLSAFQNGGIPAPEGIQHALIQATGSFSQTITGFQPGDYELSLLTMARQAGAGGNDLEVILDAGLPTEIVLIDIPQVTFNSFSEVVSPSFFASKDTYELTIRASLDGGNLTGDRTTFFDNVWFNQLSVAVPEPSTFVLFGLGLAGLLGGRPRRNRG